MDRLSDGKFTKRFDSLGQRMKRRTSSASSSSSPMSTSQSKTMNFLDLIDVEFYRVEASPLVSDVSTFLNEADLAQVGNYLFLLKNGGKSDYICTIENTGW